MERQLPGTVSPNGMTECTAIRRSGHIDRMAFVRRSPPDWCRHFDVPSGWDLSDAANQIDAARVCRTGAVLLLVKGAVAKLSGVSLGQCGCNAKLHSVW